MKIGIIGANGNVGKLLVSEALERNLDVTAIVRGENNSKAQKVIKKDLFDLTKEDLKDFDVIISAFAAWDSKTFPLHKSSLEKLSELILGTNIRLLVVGGAGSLYVDDNLKMQLKDTPDFPKEYYEVANAMSVGLDFLRTQNIDWTYISPAAEFKVDGEKTNRYILAGEQFTVNSKGESIISYSDYAVAMIDEVINKKHIRKRISVLGE